MKSLSYFDSSYSPNEACEQNDNYMDCGACSDTGMIDEQVYCDCRQGSARCDHDYEDAVSVSAESDDYTMADKLADNYQCFGDC